MRCCLLVLLAAPVIGADRLDLVREAVRSTAKSTSSWSAPASPPSRGSCHETSSVICLDFSSSDSCERRCDRAEPIRLRDPPELRGASDDAAIDGFLSAEGGWHDDLGRLGLRLGFDTDDGGMAGGVDRFYERNAPGSSHWDRLDLWRLEGALTVLGSRTTALRLGAVALLMHDAHASDGGLAALADFSVGGFPALPQLGVDTRLEYGFLGRARYLRARAELGYRLGPLEPSIGYDYLRVDDAALQGPFAGLRWHF
jgi:hypothetical protein